MNSNPEAVAFANQKLRPLADRLAQAYYLAKQVRDEWYANNMGELIPADAEVIADGSATDGRHPITNSDARLLINRAEDLILDYEGALGDKAKLNTVLNVAVNVNP